LDSAVLPLADATAEDAALHQEGTYFPFVTVEDIQAALHARNLRTLRNVLWLYDELIHGSDAHRMFVDDGRDGVPALAVETRDPRIVLAVLEHRVFVHQLAAQANRAAHAALRNGDLAILRILLLHDADFLIVGMAAQTRDTELLRAILAGVAGTPLVDLAELIHKVHAGIIRTVLETTPAGIVKILGDLYVRAAMNDVHKLRAVLANPAVRPSYRTMVTLLNQHGTRGLALLRDVFRSDSTYTESDLDAIASKALTTPDNGAALLLDLVLPLYEDPLRVLRFSPRQSPQGSQDLRDPHGIAAILHAHVRWSQVRKAWMHAVSRAHPPVEIVEVESGDSDTDVTLGPLGKRGRPFH
jgi:hypothetical protein